MSHSAPSHGSDKGAAFTGLILGALFIGCVVYGLVIWTNSRFDAHEGEGAAAEHTAFALPALPAYSLHA